MNIRAVQIYELAKPVKGFVLLLGNKSFEKQENLTRYFFFYENTGVVIFIIPPKNPLYDSPFMTYTISYIFHCFAVHFNSLDFIHQLMHFYIQ